MLIRTSHPPRNLDGIADHDGDNAEKLAARYATIDRKAAYPRLYNDAAMAAEKGEELLILDVGSGSGDDAYALAQMGHNVTAVEPSDLIKIARQKHADSRIQYVADTLPKLNRISSKPVFDAVVLGAVLQYIHPQDLPASIKRVAASMKKGGRLYISYPSPPSRPHQFKLPLNHLMTLVQQFNSRTRNMGHAPLLIDGLPQSIPDSTGRRAIDGSPLMFHNITFIKSMTKGFEA